MLDVDGTVNYNFYFKSVKILFRDIKMTFYCPMYNTVYLFNRCAKLAFQKGYKVIGIQSFGEWNKTRYIFLIKT